MEALAYSDGNIGSTGSTATICDGATWKIEKIRALVWIV